MNKHRRVIAGIATMIVLAGCEAYYQPIPKDTVMIKKITPAASDKTAESPGALSEDTARTLSVNAVNKYFNNNFSIEDVNIELDVFDLQQMKSMLYSLRRDSVADPLVQFKAELSETPNGLYSVIVKNRYDSRIQYTVMLNAADGDILDIRKLGENSSSRGQRIRSDITEFISAAEQFLERLNDIRLDELELGEQTVFREATYDAVLFFQNKKTKNTEYVVWVDLSTKEILGFSKGIMIVLSYSYLVGDS